MTNIISSIFGTYSTSIGIIVGAITMAAAGFFFMRSRAKRKVATTETAKKRAHEVNITNNFSRLPDQKTPTVEPEKNKEVKTNMSSNFSTELGKEVTAPKTTDGKKPTENIMDALHAASAQSAEDLLKEEPEKQNKASSTGAKPESKTSDDVFSLFTANIVEESNTNKFAANLDDISINALSEQAHDLLKMFKDGHQ